MSSFNSFFEQNASEGIASGNLCFFNIFKCSPAQKPPSVLIHKSGIILYLRHAVIADDKQIIKNLFWLFLIISKNGIKLGPDEIISTSLLIKLSKQIWLFIFRKKWQLLRNHFFSKYCLVIRSVFARTNAAFIFSQTVLSSSVKIWAEAFHLINAIDNNSSSVNFDSR